MGNYQTVEEFIDEFRDRVGDSTCDIPIQYIMNWLNTALRRLARARGLDKLFRYQDTFELARINEDGSAAASWTLKGIPADTGKDAPRLGMIIDIKSLLILSTRDCHVGAARMCYVPFDWFRREHPFPEGQTPGQPCVFTLNQMGGETKIIFDRPITKPYAIDMVYSAFHPRVSKLTDLVRVPYSFSDIVQEAVYILYSQESADFATARSLYEDWDFLVSEARELLAKQPDSFGPRQLRGSF